MNKEMGYLIMAIIGGAVGNFFVYFYIKTAESFLNFSREVYFILAISAAIVFFGLIYVLYKEMKK
ncbi:MAG: hypothetical protein GTN76_02825 [Candidatus Aenigmarchaeota archaeon]|nr:hypothetical protein [Candidatus Aenigmarchaeota archaeon]